MSSHENYSEAKANMQSIKDAFSRQHFSSLQTKPNQLEKKLILKPKGKAEISKTEIKNIATAEKEPMIGPKKKRGRPPKDEKRDTNDGNPVNSKKGTV